MTSVLQELVQLDKKSEIVLNDGRFASIFNVKVGHMLAAQDKDQFTQMIKLVTLVVKIDDKELTAKDVLNLDQRDFNKIIEAISK